ncbi:hypothetical protein GCM10009754_32560 [Amycolatopsis minnesotensis]|uniref:Uncharacterized protein n=2 Tax=Amycolatopsis minnesotensis TaxID=337894 RepID=A0ABN2QWW0_9PSEU
MRMTRTRVADDAFFGELEVHTDEESGSVEVSGPEVPAVAIRRRPGAEVNQFVPIGSRRSADLDMIVGGDPATILAGPGKWTRGSYQIRVAVKGGEYLFKPNSIATTQLLRDGTKLADFSMDDDEGDFIVHWIQTRERVLSVDAAVGYALPVAFRTGALGFWSMLLRGAEALPD